ncbi:MAG TPA: hypothetical protein VFQ68_18910 [Streptosporangiaceae bacterium]|nr:hypothetical protein [Streptosporangiaceae bacterium]
MMPAGLADLATRDPTDWWEASHDRVIGQSAALRGEPGSLELEQAAAGLIGGELHAALGREKMGFDMGGWAMQLVDRAAGRVRRDRDLGALWLMHGVAAIGSYGLGDYAAGRAAKVAASLPSAQPDWLGAVPAVTGGIQVIRDSYGTRLGVIAGFSYPGRAEPVTWLLDIDGGGFITIAGAGTSGSPDEAAGAWRAAVGQSADPAVPGAVDAGALTFLAACAQSEQFAGGRESRSRMDSWYRACRRLDDIVKALSERGMELPWERTRTPRAQPADPAPMIGEFSAWYAGRRGRAPDAEIVEEVAGEWLDCVVPGTERLISPTRTTLFRALIGDWREPYAAPGVALLTEWVRWLGEESGLPEALIEQALGSDQG